MVNKTNKVKTAVIIGATGLIGSSLLKQLLTNPALDNMYSQIHVLVRNLSSLHALADSHPKLKLHVTDFDQLVKSANSSAVANPAATSASIQYLANGQVDDVYCCLGTTIKKAKTKENMYRIDVEYPLAVAKLALNHGASHCLHISAVNSNSSSMFFYSKIKGQLEEQMCSLNYPHLTIFRPSLLIGERSEQRLGEELATKFYLLMQKISNKPLFKLGIHADTVAAAMIKSAHSPITTEQVAIFSPSEIYDLGKELINVKNI